MACTSIGCGVGENYSVHRGKSDLVNPPNQNARPPSALMITNRHRPSARKISMSTTTTYAKPEQRQLHRKNNKEEEEEEKEKENGAVAAREKLDVWMRDSVGEIVKNLREAPLLVHVYPGSNGTVRTTTEKAEDWHVMKGKWEKEEAQLPEGVIFVEQLEDDKNNRDLISGDDHGGGVTRAWGIVVQGKGVDCGPVCYLLKTSRVGAGSGMGMFCTHFCLVRVKSFWETTKSQLNNCWLLQGNDKWSIN